MQYLKTNFKVVRNNADFRSNLPGFSVLWAVINCESHSGYGVLYNSTCLYRFVHFFMVTGSLYLTEALVDLFIVFCMLSH